MLFLIMKQRRHQELCVLRVSPEVLDLQRVVVTDQNAASDYVRWGRTLAIVDRHLVFAERWTHPDDQIAEWRHKSTKCAEVLVPDRVGPEHVLGVDAGFAGPIGNEPAQRIVGQPGYPGTRASQPGQTDRGV